MTATASQTPRIESSQPQHPEAQHRSTATPPPPEPQHRNTSNLPEPQHRSTSNRSTILIIAAHPDDCESGCGGSAARWAAEGHRVVLCVATNGDKGSDDPSMTSDTLIALRDKEQRAAASRLGIQEVVILPNGDGELADDRRFRGQIVRLIRKHRPDRVVTHNPYHWQHRDHRMTGQVTLDAVYPFARDRLHFPELRQEGLTPHKTAEVYLWAGFNDDREWDVDVDVTDFLGAKLEALACHESQFGPPEEARQRWSTRWERLKEERGGRLTERFKRVEYPA